MVALFCLCDRFHPYVQSDIVFEVFRANTVILGQEATYMAVHTVDVLKVDIAFDFGLMLSGILGGIGK